MTSAGEIVERTPPDEMGEMTYFRKMVEKTSSGVMWAMPGEMMEMTPSGKMVEMISLADGTLLV